jgi:hypothetical protein
MRPITRQRDQESVSKKKSNLWITFLLPFWHEGNDGNLKVPFKSQRQRERARGRTNLLA